MKLQLLISILSAYETRIDKSKSADELVILSHSFVQVGINSVGVSLWPVYANRNLVFILPSA